MTISDGCLSLKLECALRELGFVEIDWCVIAHAGLFFVSPVGFGKFSLQDDLIGFEVAKSFNIRKELRADHHIAPTAKMALDWAFRFA